MKNRPDKRNKDLHNLIYVEENDKTESERPLVEWPGDLAVDENLEISSSEVDKLDKQIGDSVSLLARFKRRANLLAIIFFLVAVAGILVYAGLAATVNAPPTAVEGTATNPESPFERLPDYSLKTADFIPFFSHINDAVFYNGHTWVATHGGLIKYNDLGAVFYGAQDGLSGEGVVSLTIAGDVLWTGYHGGVARYDSVTDSFTNFLNDVDGTGILNTVVFYDEVGKELMLSSSDGVYNFDAQNDTWIKSKDSDAPRDVYNFVAGSEGVFAVDRPAQENGGDIKIYSRSSKDWRSADVSAFDDTTTQVFRVNEEVVALGHVASSTSNFYHRTGGGWSAVSSYNQTLSNNATYLTSPQTNNDSHIRIGQSYAEDEIYTLTYRDEVFSSNRVEIKSSVSLADDRLFAQIRDRLIEISGLKPWYEIYDIDQNGAQILGYRSSDLSVGPEGVLYAKTGFDQAKEILKLKPNSIFAPIMCNERDGRRFSYAFSGVFNSFNGKWEEAKFYSFENEELKFIKDISSQTIDRTLLKPSFICTGSSIVWPTSGAIWQLSRNDNKISKVSDIEEGNLTAVSDEARYMFLWDQDKTSSTIYRYDADKKETTAIDSGRQIAGGEEIALQQGYLWIPSTRSETIHIYDLNGNRIKEIIHEGVGGVRILNGGPNQVLIVQKLASQSVNKNYTLVNTQDFSVKQIQQSTIPTAASNVTDLVNKTAVYDPINKRLWVGGVSFSLFAIDLE